MKTMTQQPDFISCGIFAIANVTSLLLKQNPRTYNLLLNGKEYNSNVTMCLRTKLVEIICNNPNNLTNLKQSLQFIILIRID